MTIGSILRGVAKGADEVASVSDEAFRRTLKDAKFNEQFPDPPLSPGRQIDEDFPDPPLAEVEEVENLTDEEFSALLKSVKQESPPQVAPPVAQVEELDDVSDEEFLNTLKSFKEGAPTETENLTASAAKTFLADEVGMPIEDIPFDLVSEEQIKELAEQVQSGLITNKEAFDTIAGVTSPKAVISPGLAITPTLKAVGLTQKQIDNLPASFQSGLSNFFKSEDIQNSNPEELVGFVNQKIKEADIAGVEIQPGQLKVPQVASSENALDLKLSEVERGIITPEEAAENPDVVERAKLSILGNTTINEDQIDLLSNADAIKLNSQIFAPRDDISLILAQNADNLRGSFPLPLAKPDQPEFRPVAATLFAVRGGGIGRMPRKIRQEIEDEVAFANESAFVNNAFREDIETVDQVTDLDVIKNLSDIEIASINFYTKQGDEAVNKALRRGEVREGSALDQTIQFMNSTLDQLPSYEGVTYRQVPDINVFDLYEVGEETTEAAFTSTTLKELAQPEELGLRRVIFVVQGKNGKYIEPMTMPNFRGEHEVLFKSGTRFRVVDKDEENLQIFLEEIE